MRVVDPGDTDTGMLREKARQLSMAGAAIVVAGGGIA